MRCYAIVEDHVLLAGIGNFRVLGQYVDRVYLFIVITNCCSFIKKEGLSIFGDSIQTDSPKFEEVVAPKGHEVISSWPIVPLYYFIDHSIVKFEC